MDSDNFAPESYFQAWNAYLGDSVPDLNTLYMPVRTIPQENHGGFDYSIFSGKKYTKDTYKQLFNFGDTGKCACNTGNYIFSKKLYTTSRASLELEKYQYNSALDVLFKNYNIWESGGTSIFVPGMEYHHIVHPGSFYIESSTLGTLNQDFFYSLYTPKNEGEEEKKEILVNYI